MYLDCWLVFGKGSSGSLLFVCIIYNNCRLRHLHIAHCTYYLCAHTHTHIFALSLQVTVMLAPMVVETPDGTTSGSLLHFILWPCIGGVLLLIAAAILLYFVSHLQSYRFSTDIIRGSPYIHTSQIDHNFSLEPLRLGSRLP